jgi:hypothetical protein
MVEKPITGDEEQRRANVRASRFQSGLPPEEELVEEAAPVKRPRPERAEPRADREDDVA